MYINNKKKILLHLIIKFSYVNITSIFKKTKINKTKKEKVLS